MSKGIYKNYQINVGNPFQVKSPMGLNPYTVQHVKLPQEDEQLEDVVEEDEEVVEQVSPEKLAEEIIQEAREEADLIIKEAHLEGSKYFNEISQEIEKNKEITYREAFEKGYKEGMLEAEEQYKNIITEASEIRDKSLVDYEQSMASLEADAIKLIMEIAKKVIGDEIKVNKNVLLSMAAQAFNKCAVKDEIVMKVSSDDYDFVIENKEELLASTEGIGGLEIKKDSALKPGACIVETPFGSLDAGIETKLKLIEEEFTDAISGNNIEIHFDDEDE